MFLPPYSKRCDGLLVECLVDGVDDHLSHACWLVGVIKGILDHPKSVCSAGHNYPLLFSGGQPDNQSHLGIRDGKQILILDDDENTLRGILRKDSVQRESPYAQAKHWLGNIAPWC